MPCAEPSLTGGGGGNVSGSCAAFLFEVFSVLLCIKCMIVCMSMYCLTPLYTM